MEIWQRVPSACNSSSRSSSLLAPIGVGGSRVPVAPPRGISAGLGGKQMELDPNKPESMRVTLNLI